MRTKLIVGAVLVGLAAVSLTADASAAPRHTFSGACQIAATVTGSYTEAGFRVAGTGTCTGMLDGAQVTETPVSVTTRGSGLSFIGGWTNGFGTLVFGDAKVTFPIGFQAFAPGPIRVYPSCFGCAGAALGVVDPVTPTQPQPSAIGPQTAIRVAVATIREFVA